MKNIFSSMLILLVLGSHTLFAQTSGSQCKPRVVVLTDVSTWETDDTESLVRFLVHADMYEIEGIVWTTGYSHSNIASHPTHYDIIHNVIDAYELDLPNLLKRSDQSGHSQDTSRQEIGYWPSADYVRDRTMWGSERRGMQYIGAGNNSDGSNLIIDLADEGDDRPVWVTVWGGGNTLAQAIWQVQQSRSNDELRAFLHKIRVYTITDQDRNYDGSEGYEVSSHQWMRREFADDLLFIWDECAWGFQNGTGVSNWSQYVTHIQGHGNLGNQYPHYEYGVEGDTPSFLHVMPNGLNNPEVPTQCGWGGYSVWGLSADNQTYAYTNHTGSVYNTCRSYEQHFYPATFNNFAARMDWAQDGAGNRNPVVIIDGDDGVDILIRTPQPGSVVTLDASDTYDPDSNALTYDWWIQPEAGTYSSNVTISNNSSNVATVNVPADSDGKTFHIICEVKDNGTHNLFGYRRIIFRPRTIEGDTDIWLEAECGTVGSLWNINSDSIASNDEYVIIKSGNNSTGGAPTTSNGQISYTFNASEAGIYTAWARVIAPATDDDSFWINMDGGSWLSWNDISPSTSWTWADIDTFSLGEGYHTFTVAYNEDGTQLDKLFITSSDSIPSGEGGAATNCLSFNLPPVAFAGPDQVVTDRDSSGTETVTLNGSGSIDHDGYIASHVWSEGDSLIATEANPTLNFSIGTHNITLTVTDNEGATDKDDVTIVVNEKGFGEDHWFEPECATAGENWDILTDGGTSNGYYVTVKSHLESLTNAPTGSDNQIEIPFSLNTSGSFSIYARINCPTYDDDSFWVKVDDGSFTMHNGLVTSGWEWIKFDDFVLTEGAHTLTIAYRENGAKLDKICVSNYPEDPSEMGEEAENLCDPTSILNSIEVPEDYVLEQNYPNPFNPSTTIKYNLKKPGHVVLIIYNINGKEIDILVDKYLKAGEYKTEWQPKGLASGLYYYRLQAGEFSQTRKFILLK